MNLRDSKIIEEIRIKARKLSAPCYWPGCSNKAIRSHIQQAEGPLREIAPSGKVYQIDLLFDYVKEEYEYKFKLSGINDGEILRFRGFCNSCDTRLFKRIESDAFDPYNYESQLLHGYRGFMNEMYKVDSNLRESDLVLSDQRVTNERKVSYRKWKERQECKAFVMNLKKAKFELDIIKGTRSFEFLALKLPRYEICTSAVHYLPIVKMPSQQIMPGPTATLALIPTKDELICIRGLEKDPEIDVRKYLDSLLDVGTESQLKGINDILIKFVETWCISVNWFEKLQRKVLNVEIERLMQQHLPLTEKLKPVNFNLFNEI